MFDAVTYALAKNAAKKYTDYVATTIEWETEIVDTVPDPAEADGHTIYFVPADPEDPTAGYIEYIKVNGSMEPMGNTSMMPDISLVGFAADPNYDNILIIESDTKYNDISTFADFIAFAENALNTQINEEYMDALEDSFNYIDTISDADKLKCWYVFYKYTYREGLGSPYKNKIGIGFVYSTGEVYAVKGTGKTSFYYYVGAKNDNGNIVPVQVDWDLWHIDIENDTPIEAAGTWITPDVSHEVEIFTAPGNVITAQPATVSQFVYMKNRQED